MLTQEKLLNGRALVGGVVDEDEREHGDARQRVRQALACVRFEIEELARMPNECEAKRREVRGVGFGIGGHGGEGRLILRRQVAAAPKPIEDFLEVWQFAHALASWTGCASRTPSAVG